MDGFEFFIYSGAAIILFVLLVSWLLRNKYPDKPYDVLFGLGVTALGLIVIPFGFVIGGWSGMGLGIIGMTVMIAAAIGMSIYLALKVLFGEK
ncbi:YesK-like family protein [Bacillus sp. CECT 9360]|uniref:YesK-like family protein n=1 Tax=Bacillus sp. CECT 9360 TaxID=2845821 RepID=UPI001E2C0F95|nr:YesK-like family protein [Bacillus sp. CECT 9360]CAH0347317.1 hypothetical protein BCI9360_03710 [Bacillus sp. CECT 9360]